MICLHCERPIEPIAHAVLRYTHRHTDDKKISCYGIYEPENATPATEEV